MRSGQIIDWRVKALGFSASNFMKNKNAVLEYCVTNSPGRRKWSFRFKSKQGRVLMNSGERYASLDEAVGGFITLVKSIASNQYRIKDSCKLTKAEHHE